MPTGIDTHLWHSLDRWTRSLWRLVGRRLDLAGPHRWLAAPTTPAGGAGDDWLTVAAWRDLVQPPAPSDGLLADMAELDGPGFRADGLHPAIRDFYQHTSRWRLDVWSQWSPLFAPGGEIIARLFGRRVGQLALPVQPLAVSRGMDSRIRIVRNAAGARSGAAWLRTLRMDGSAVFSGYYQVGMVPLSDRPHVHVTFPLEDGNVQVFLMPSVDPDGSLWLRSRPGPFGGDGAYVVAGSGGAWHAAKVPLHESFHVFVDDEQVLRTDHHLRVGRLRALTLHYRLSRLGTEPS